MGVFQSVGGAATSGQSLNDAHIRAAIIAALKQSETIDQERRIDLFNRLNGGEKAHEMFGDGDYTAEQTSEDVPWSVERNNAPDAAEEVAEANEDGAHEKLSVVEYAPDVFAALRLLAGTSNDNFKAEWTRAPPKSNTHADKIVSEGKMELGEGRSGAFFLKSKSMAFMCKTISETEVHVLMGILPKYLKFLEKNPESMLMRFVMMLKVSLGDTEPGYILCFADCFSNCTVLHERWDLKGRAPKPGKFRHFEKHDLQKNNSGDGPNGSKSSAAAAAHDDGDTSTDSEDEMAHQRGRKGARNIRTADSRKALRLMTYKDKNLARLFWLEPNVRTELMEQFKADFGFLNSCGLMDYSILIGVRYNSKEETVKKEINRDLNATNNGGKAMRQVFALGDETAAGVVEVRNANMDEEELNSTRAFLTQMNTKSSKFHQGVDNLLCAETYYIGIIDMLTVYNAKKMTANFCKTFLWREKTLSTIPPVPYRKRIIKYAHQIFPLVQVQDGVAQPADMQGKHDGMVRVAGFHSPNNFNMTIGSEDDAPFVASSSDDEEEAFLNTTCIDDPEEPTPLHAAAAAGNVEQVNELLRGQANPVARDSSGRTPLHYGVKSGKVAVVRELIGRGKTAVTIADRNGHTPLHVAALEGRAKMTKLLIAAGADIDVRDRAGCTALHLAVENFHQDVAEILIDAKADLNLTEEEGLTALACALNNDDNSMVDLLRRSGAREANSVQ